MVVGPSDPTSNGKKIFNGADIVIKINVVFKSGKQQVFLADGEKSLEHFVGLASKVGGPLKRIEFLV